MKNRQYIIGIALALCMISCEKDDIDTYNEEYNAVRFASNEMIGGNQRENGGLGYSNIDDCLYVSYSFLNDPLAASHDCEVAITLIGKPNETDYEVAYSIDKERSTAPEDSYEILESRIPAHKAYGHIMVRVKNMEELQDATYELYFKLQPSKELAVGPKEYITAKLSWNNQVDEPMVSHHIRTYNMMINSPADYVSTSKSYYSPNALKAIVGALGWDDWDDYAVHGAMYNNSTTYQSYKYLPRYVVIYNDMSYKGYAAKLKDYLKKYEQENGTPLLHDAGLSKGKPVEARTY